MIPKFLRGDYRSEIVGRRRRHQCVTRELRVRWHFGERGQPPEICGAVVRDCRAASPLVNRHAAMQTAAEVLFTAECGGYVH